MPCQCLGPWSPDRVYVLACFFQSCPSQTSDSWGASATRPASPLWGAAWTVVCSDMGHHWKASVAHATQAQLRTAIYEKLASRDASAIRMEPSQTSDSWGASATRPASPLWGAAWTVVCSDMGHHWKASVAHATQAQLRTAIYEKLASRDASAIRM